MTTIVLGLYPTMMNQKKKLLCPKKYKRFWVIYFPHAEYHTFKLKCLNFTIGNHDILK